MSSETPWPAMPLDDATRGELAEWVRQHWDAVFTLAYRMAGNRPDAEDLTQEAFLRAARQRGSFAAGTNLRAWLMRIATNAFLDTQRRRQILRMAPLQEDIAEDSGPRPADGVRRSELADALADALQQLPEMSRVVFLLRAEEGFAFREIAEAIGSTEPTARWHMMNARRRLMGLLQGWL